MIREEPDPEADHGVDPPRKTRSRFVIGEEDARITGRCTPDDAEVKEADRLLSKVLRRRDQL